MLILILIKSKRSFIIYHQFEIVIPNEATKIDRFLLKQIIKRFKKVDLVIIPEVNRLNYFKYDVVKNQTKTEFFMLPNTNDNLVILEYNNLDKIRICHIGALGNDHCFEGVLDALCLLPEEKYELYLVGNITKDVRTRISSFNKPNIIITGQIKHNELEEIYKKTHIGLILYDDTDLNTKYCAPNKLYEFWSYGIPVIGNQLPGMVDVFKNESLGTLIDLKNPILISTAIRNLASNVLINKRVILEIFKKEYKLENYLNVIKEKI